MTASATDKFKKVASNTGWQLDASGISDAVVDSFGLVNASGLPTDTAVIVTIDRVDASGAKTPTKMERIVGIISSNNIISCLRGVEGTAQAHAGGAVVEILISAKNFNDLIAGFLVQHNQDGTHQSTVDLPYGMARQAIMNGNFDVWQRGTSVALADGILIADRWQENISGGGGTLPTLTSSRQLQTSGDIVNSYYFNRLATNGAGTSLGVNSYDIFLQKIENGTSKLCGLNKKVTISFWARSSIANKRICPTLDQHYGTGGSPTATEYILGTPITLTSTWTKYTATFTTNTLVGKTFGTNNDNYVGLAFWKMWGSTIGNTRVQAGVTAETFVGAGNIDIAQVQLCSGDVALPFQPKSYEEELRACQRYYEVGECHIMGYASAAGGLIGNTITYKVTKRTVASPTLATPTENVNIASVVTSPVTMEGFRYYIVTTAGGSAYRTGTFSISVEL